MPRDLLYYEFVVRITVKEEEKVKCRGAITEHEGIEMLADTHEGKKTMMCCVEY